MAVILSNRQRTKKINSRRLHQIVTALLAEVQVTEADLGIALVGAAAMARVNWQFLRHTGATDVITFDHAETPPAKSGPRPPLHGELFICVDVAVQQAKAFRASWQAEVVRYVVHGVLHLLGYDDLQPALRRAMKREENRLVRRLARQFSFAQLGRRS